MLFYGLFLFRFTGCYFVCSFFSFFFFFFYFFLFFFFFLIFFLRAGRRLLPSPYVFTDFFCGGLGPPGILSHFIYL